MNDDVIYSLSVNLPYNGEYRVFEYTLDSELYDKLCDLVLRKDLRTAKEVQDPFTDIYRAKLPKEFIDFNPHLFPVHLAFLTCALLYIAKYPSAIEAKIEAARRTTGALQQDWDAETAVLKRFGYIDWDYQSRMEIKL